MQTHNSTTQHAETVLNVVNRVKGDPPKHGHSFFGHDRLGMLNKKGHFGIKSQWRESKV
jgi:hypothetical protein